ncbi:hypothetical protein GmHk_07G019846 [Glycine max]|nr:hypothetical protein GmHk_07G019846 [Glycine max]
MKWKMAGTKKTGQMTSEAAKEIANRIDSLEKQASHKALSPMDVRITKGSCVDPLGKVPEIGDLDNFGLYVDDNPSRLITLGRVYEGSTTIHNILLGNDQMKVGVQEVRDANAHILVPIQEDKQVAEAPAKLVHMPNLDVDLLYLMTLTIPQLFLKLLQVSWDAMHIGKFVILPKDNVVIWFCSLHKRPDNYLKEIINGALKGFNDGQGSKSKASIR